MWCPVIYLLSCTYYDYTDVGSNVILLFASVRLTPLSSISSQTLSCIFHCPCWPTLSALELFSVSLGEQYLKSMGNYRPLPCTTPPSIPFHSTVPVHQIQTPLNSVFSVVVIARGSGIYASKRTESEGKVWGQSLFTSINPWPAVQGFIRGGGGEGKVRVLKIRWGGVTICERQHAI